MQALGSAALMAAYEARIRGHHDYDLTVDVLDTEENPVASATLIDGQINLLPDADIRRTSTCTLLDPDHSLGLDAGTVYQGALFADRMIRIRHSVNVPGFGTVTCTPFVGPIVRLNRNGATIDLECQDKTGLAILGTRPITMKKGMNSVAAIRQILTDRCGETRFQFPEGTKHRLSHDHSVGWADEASPWAVCRQIAWGAGMQLFYSSDGRATLRPRPTTPVFDFDQDTITSAPVGDYDFSAVVNYARVAGGDKIVRTAIADPAHPLSPANLGRNGVDRYLPTLGEVNAPPDRPSRPGTKHRVASKAQLHKYAEEMEKWNALVKSTTGKAQAMASALLAAGLPLTASISFDAVPVFHLDVDDPVRITTDEGSAVLQVSAATIPLVSGDMTVGAIRRGRPTRIKN